MDLCKRLSLVYAIIRLMIKKGENLRVTKLRYFHVYGLLHIDAPGLGDQQRLTLFSSV